MLVRFAVLFAFFAMLRVATAAVALRPLNVSYTDQDMVLIYQPEIPQITEPVAPSAWNISYSEITWAERVLRSQGRGFSRHFTSFPGAFVSLTFVGTDLYFYGAVGNDTSIGLLVDGARKSAPRPSTPETFPGAPEGVTLISSVTGLEYGSHEVALVLDSGSLSISNVTMTTQIQTEAIDATMTDVAQMRTVNPINNMTESIMKLTPDIITDNAMCFEGLDTQPCFVYQRLNSNNRSARYEFPIVAGTSFLQLLSANDFYGSFYTINVSPQPPHTTGDFNSTTRSLWAAKDAIMYHAVLDPTVSYTVVLRPNVDFSGYRGGYLNLAQIRTYYASCYKCTSEQKNAEKRPPVTEPTPSTVAAPPAKSKSGSNVGAIAGGVVGGVVGLALLGLLLFFFCRRSKDKRESHVGTKELMFEENNHEMINPIPYTPPPPAPPSDYPQGVSPISGVRSPTDTTFSSSGIDTALTDGSQSGLTKSRYMAAAPMPPPRAPYPASTLSTAPSVPPSSTLLPSAPERHVEQLSDAGRIVEYVPPRYDEEWQHEPHSPSAR